jgi:hypothetical protein
VPLKLLAAALLCAACGSVPAADGCASDSDCMGGRCVVATGVCIEWPDAAVPDLGAMDALQLME